MDLKQYVSEVQDWPKPGVSFKDITTLIGDGEGLKASIDAIVDYLKDKNIDLIVGPEARGFIFGVPVAYALGVGFVPVRKPGKLPAETISVTYDLEYGSDEIQIHKDAIKPGQRIAIVDDLLATGGTVEAVTKLVEQAGGIVASVDFVTELTDLRGRDKLQGYDVMSLVEYDC